MLYHIHLGHVFRIGHLRPWKWHQDNYKIDFLRAGIHLEWILTYHVPLYIFYEILWSLFCQIHNHMPLRKNISRPFISDYNPVLASDRWTKSSANNKWSIFLSLIVTPLELSKYDERSSTNKLNRVGLITPPPPFPPVVHHLPSSPFHFTQQDAFLTYFWWHQKSPTDAIIEQLIKECRPIDQIESGFEINKTNKNWTAVSFGFINEAIEDEYDVCRPRVFLCSYWYGARVVWWLGARALTRS